MSLLHRTKRKTDNRRRSEQRKRAKRRLQKQRAADIEPLVGEPAIALTDADEKRIRLRRQRKASKRGKKEPQPETLNGLESDDRRTKENTLAMVETAVSDRWPVTPTIREKIVAKVVDIATSPEEGTKHQLAAARILVMADSVNAGREKSTQRSAGTTVNIGIVNAPPAERAARIDSIAAQIGLPAPSE